MTTPIDTYGISGLESLMETIGQPKFRARQIFSWIYGHGVKSFDEMTNVPNSLRLLLGVEAPLYIPRLVNKQTSSDGTRKYVFELHDGSFIEAVGIPSGRFSHNGKDNEVGAAEPQPKTRQTRLTVCFSTQVGCPMGCAFCATGKEGFVRNLSPGEIAQQLILVSQDFGLRATNAVAMGQGEPFLNYNNTLEALRIINHPDALGIGARSISVSTCGINDAIRRFGSIPEQFTLALSLHSAQQKVRDSLMPKCAKTPLKTLKKALVDYQQQSGRRITLEYLLISGVNDTAEAFEALLAFCKGLAVHVNLLPLNNVEGTDLVPSRAAVMRSWEQKLADSHIPVSVRASRGSDISGACGQLKNELSAKL